jgi:hypothetical protein
MWLGIGEFNVHEIAKTKTMMELRMQPCPALVRSLGVLDGAEDARAMPLSPYFQCANEACMTPRAT